MPSTITHAAVGLGLGEMYAPGSMPWPFYVLSMALGAAPDLDVLAFSFGIPYGSFFGHRGFFHSLFFALLAGLGFGVATAAAFGQPWWCVGLYWFGVLASHGILDGFTNGGFGIAYFSPFDPTRYFFPWQPIQVAPIGLAFFGPWGVRVLRSEAVWVWLPLAVVWAGVWKYRGVY